MKWIAVLNGLVPTPSRRSVLLGFSASLLLLVVVGCSSGDGSTSSPATTDKIVPAPTAESAEPAPTPAPTSAPVPVATPEPEVENTAKETEPVKVPEPTSVPVPTATTAPVATAEPTATPSPTPTPTPVPLTNVYNLYGFTVELDQDATFATSNLNIDGWSESDATTAQGLMTFEYNGADIVIFWQPKEDSSTPQNTVDLTYQLQELGKPDLTFAPLNEGDLTVDGSAGRFAGFLTSDASGGNAAGGLIGAWTCPDSNTQLSLTATSPDSTALQIRFDRLTSGFSCATK